MIKLILTFLFVLTSQSLFSQSTVSSFKQAEAEKIDILKIDEKYSDAIHADPDQGVFTERQDEFIDRYRELLTGLAIYLNTEGFYWEQTTRMFTRIYFSKNGTVDYFFYNAEEAGFDSLRNDMFSSKVSEFLGNYSMDIVSDTPYAQCSPITYMNAQKKNNNNN